MKQYISYLRVSTNKQGFSGYGIDAQRSAVEQFIRYSGGSLIAEYVEVESGANKRRPVLTQSIAHTKTSGSTLLIARLDRLARNVAFVSTLMESGVEFVAVDAPYANKLMIHILAAFAEHERELISERTKLALSAAKRRGITLGENGRRLAKINRASAIDAAQPLRRPVQIALSSGARTLQDIADRLNGDGFNTRQGANWSPSTVKRLLGRLGIDHRPSY